jgi:hypothetical protein
MLTTHELSKKKNQVKVHTPEGTEIFSKVGYRCKACPKANFKDINYHVGKLFGEY